MNTLFVIGALLLAGCSGGENATPQASSSNAPAPSVEAPSPVNSPVPAPVANPGKYKGTAFLDLSNLRLDGISATLIPQNQQQAVVTFDGATRSEDMFVDSKWEERTLGSGNLSSSSSPSLFLVSVELAPGQKVTNAVAWVERAGFVQAGDESGVLTISIPYGLSQSEFLDDPNFTALSTTQLIVDVLVDHGVLQTAGAKDGILSVSRTFRANERVAFNLRPETSSYIMPPSPEPQEPLGQ